MIAHFHRLAPAVIAAIACLAPVAGARAQSSFRVNLSYSEAVLDARDSAEAALVAHYEAWDSAFARVAKRNMPFIEITNTSTADTPLTQFQMTIAKPEFDFSDNVLLSYAKLGVTTPGIQITSSSPDDGDTLLVVNFAEGLQRNETVRFQVDIDVDPAYPNLYPHPDYRMVFFDVNGNDNSDNSVLTATWETDNGLLSKSLTLPDFAQDTPVYLNGAGVRSYNTMDGAEIFETPEPAGLALALIPLAALRGRRRARR